MKLNEMKQRFDEKLKNTYSPAEIGGAFLSLQQKCSASLSDTQDLTVEQLNFFEDALGRMGEKEPVVYILGEADFYGRKFKVNAHVHVPRPESETMIQWVLEDFIHRQKENLSLLDIGTGSGVLPITFAMEMPALSITAIDISENALDVAKENAERFQTSIKFLSVDVFRLETLPKTFDIIVSNPPYILKHAQRDVQRAFLSREPVVALYIDDEDPMIFNRKIASLAQSGLKENGAVYVEINQYLQKESASIFKEFGFETEFRKDVFGNPRTLKAVRKK